MRLKFATILLAAAAVTVAPGATYADLIAGWTFDPAPATPTAGPRPAEAGANLGAGSPASAFHAGASTYANVAGNNTPNSFSSNNWQVGDYYQFSTSTLGYNTLTFSFQQTSSGTGPRDFQVAYSTDGMSFSNLGAVYSIPANAAPNTWSSGGPLVTAAIFTVNLPASLENQSAIYLRLVQANTNSAGGGTVASGGTSRVDTVNIEGAAVPEPGAVLFGVLVCSVLGLGIGGKRLKEKLLVRS